MISRYLLIFLFTVCLSLLLGCDASAQSSQLATSSNLYSIKLENGTLSINNQTLPLPMSIDELTQKIGPFTRFAEQANDIYTYDADGFIIWSRPGQKTAYQIGIYIEKDKPVEPDSFSPTGRRFVDSRPKQDFSGTLILNGVTVTPSLSFETLNAKISGAKFNRTHWADQYMYYAKIPGTDKYYRVIAYLLEDRKIEYIEISFDPSLLK